MKKWYLKFASFDTPNDIFDKVKNGTKTIETRPISPESSKNPANYKIGDTLVLQSLDTNEVIEKEIRFVHVYTSVEQMAKNEDSNLIFPGVMSTEGLIQVFEKAKKKWGKEYSERLEKHGIVAIGI